MEKDNIPTKEEIAEFEKENQIKLPEKYIYFLSKYGGGYFGFANIFSLDKDSNFYLLKYNKQPFDKNLNIADNGCGDYYFLNIENGKCSDTVYLYDHDSKEMFDLSYTDVLEYLVKVGLNK